MESPLQQPILVPPPGKLQEAAAALRKAVQTNVVKAREHNAAFLYTGASVLVSICSMISGMVMMRYITPEDLGLWQSVRLAVTYAPFVMAGVTNGLSRELPYYFGRADDAGAARLAGTAQLYLLGAGLLVLMGGVASLLVLRHHETKLLWAVAAVTVSIIATFYTNYLIVTFRSSKAFKDYSKIKLVEALCTVGTIPLVIYLGYGGMLGRILILALLVLACMHWLRPLRISPCWNWDSLVSLLKTGVPIFALDYVASSASTCDRLVLLKLGGVATVGYYWLALTAREAISIVPGALSEYIYPRMSYSYGQHHDPVRLWRMAVKSSLLVVAFMIPAVAVGWFLMPPVVSKLFPKYTEAVTAAQWLLVAAIFSGATLGRMAIWSMKDWKLMTWYQVLSIVFTIAGPVLGGWLGQETPLLGVSLGILISQAAWLPVAGCLVYLATHRRRSPPEQA